MRPSEQNLKEGLLEDTGESFQAEALSPGDGSKYPGILYSFPYLIIILNILIIINKYIINVTVPIYQMDRWRLAKIIWPAQPASALSVQGQRLRQHTLTNTGCNAQVAKVKKRRSETAEEEKPTPGGTSLSGPQLRKVTQPAASAWLYGATLPWIVPPRKARERHLSAALLPGSLIQVHPAESRLLHAQVVILNSLQAALGKRSHSMEQDSSRLYPLKFGHQRCCTFHRSGYSTLSRKSRPGDRQAQENVVGTQTESRTHTVSALWGCPYHIPDWMAYKQQKSISHSVGDWEVQDQSADKFCV